MARSKLRRALFVLACSTPLLAACNAILGLSDYEQGACNGGRTLDECRGDSGPDDRDTGTDTGTDSGADVNAVDATGTAPVSWVQFKMPNYPEGGPFVPTYDPQEGNTGAFVDSVSKLVWRPVGDTPKEKDAKTLEEAKAFCKGITTPGAPYRVPTRIELISLLDLSRPTTTANEVLKLAPETYWTTSAYRVLPPGATASVVTAQSWGVSFKSGSSDFLEKLDTKAAAGRVICIQGL